MDASTDHYTRISTHLQKQHNILSEILHKIDEELRKLKSEEDHLEYLITQRMFPVLDEGDDEWKLLDE